MQANKFRKWYDALIKSRQGNIPTGYKENHHILPKSLGGSNDKSNMVYLTGREHWVAHLLLHRIYKNKQTAHACNMMAMRCEERGISYIKSSRLYEHVRKEHAKYASKTGKERVGDKNGSFGTYWVSNLDEKKSKKIPKDEPIPLGWVKGRVTDWSNESFVETFIKSLEPVKTFTISCIECGCKVETKKGDRKFCSRKCNSSHSYKSINLITITRNGETKETRRENYSAYKKTGWIKVD